MSDAPDGLTVVECPPCRVCGNRALLEVPEDGLIRFLVLGLDVQVAFPDFDPDRRELLITGTHAHCWERLFGGDDD